MKLKEFVKLALEEDVRDGDHTSLSTIPKDAQGSMFMLVKEDGILPFSESTLKVSIEHPFDIMRDTCAHRLLKTLVSLSLIIRGSLHFKSKLFVL